MKKQSILPSFQQILLSRLILLSLAALLSFAITAQPNLKSSSTNELFAGISAAGKGPGNFNYGANFSFSHPLKGKLGITGDAGIYFGKNGAISNKRFQLLGGAELLPNESQDRKVLLSPHLLLGVTDINSKYKFETNSFSNNQAGFTLATGVNILFPINKKTSFAIRTDYTPTLMTGRLNHDLRIGAGIKIAFEKDKTDHPSTQQKDIFISKEKFVCQASGRTEEEKFEFDLLTTTVKAVETGLKVVPNVDIKLKLNPTLSVKKGEECCSKDKPPAIYRELKGGVEAEAKIDFRLAGLPNVDVSLKLWPVMLRGQIICGLFIRPYAKFNVDPTGKIYGSAPNDPRPDCKSCVYATFKISAGAQIDVEAKLAVGVYHWHIFGKGKAGFDTDGDPDENFEISARAGLESSLQVSAKKVLIGDCGASTPWKVRLEPLKAFLKFKLELGPIKFSPTFEVPIFDAYETTF